MRSVQMHRPVPEGRRGRGVQRRFDRRLLAMRAKPAEPAAPAHDGGRARRGGGARRPGRAGNRRAAWRAADGRHVLRRSTGHGRGRPARSRAARRGARSALRGSGAPSDRDRVRPRQGLLPGTGSGWEACTSSLLTRSPLRHAAFIRAYLGVCLDDSNSQQPPSSRVSLAGDDPTAASRSPRSLNWPAPPVGPPRAPPRFPVTAALARPPFQPRTHHVAPRR